jgi:hypothetical protein
MLGIVIVLAVFMLQRSETYAVGIYGNDAAVVFVELILETSTNVCDISKGHC